MDFHDDGFRGYVAITELCTYTSLFSNYEVRRVLFDALISVICQEKIPVIFNRMIYNMVDLTFCDDVYM